MVLIDHTVTFQKRRNTTRAKELFKRENQHLEKTLKKNKCCAMETTGTHPQDDQHICLRTKGHKGYHTDKTTGFTWKWETT